MPHQQPVIPVVSADEHRFELIHVAAEQPRASLFFLPGMGLTARQYIDFARSLTRHGIESYIHEWRGLGSSSLRAGRQVNWGYRELLELDLPAAIDQIEGRSEGRPLVFAGHSLGSQLACLLAALHPDRCQGIVIIAGGSPYWRTFPALKGLGLRLGLSLMPAIAASVGHYPGRQLGFAGREARSLMADWARTGRTGVYRPPGIDRDLEQAMAELELPLLGLRLAEDGFVPEASLHWLTDKVPLATVSQRVITSASPEHRADHYGWMKHPGNCAAAIAEWIGTEAQRTEATKRA